MYCGPGFGSNHSRLLNETTNHSFCFRRRKGSQFQEVGKSRSSMALEDGKYFCNLLTVLSGGVIEPLSPVKGPESVGYALASTMEEKSPLLSWYRPIKRVGHGSRNRDGAGGRSPSTLKRKMDDSRVCNRRYNLRVCMRSDSRELHHAGPRNAANSYLRVAGRKPG